MSEAVKHDTGKPQLQWLPYDSLAEIANVMEFGANKYGNKNYELGMPWSRMAGAALRHIYQWMSGEDTDKESGLSHLAHAGCCIVFLLWYSKHKKELDDRYKT